MCTGLDNIGAQRLSSGVLFDRFLWVALLALCIFTFFVSRLGSALCIFTFVAFVYFLVGPCSQLPGVSTFGCHDHQGACILYQWTPALFVLFVCVVVLVLNLRRNIAIHRSVLRWSRCPLNGTALSAPGPMQSCVAVPFVN